MNRGFSIIETLVAITILMIAVAGPLSAASKGLTAATYARDLMTATSLAQESMEIIKNTRDNNLYYGAVGDNWLRDSYDTDPKIEPMSACTETSPCDVSALDGFIKNSDCVNRNDKDACRLYINDQGYSHFPTYNGASSLATQFYRKFYLTDAQSNNPKEERTVHVVMDWTIGTIPYHIDIASELVNNLR